MMQLSPLRAHLTAIKSELVFTGADDFFDLRTYPIESTDLGGRQRQAVGGEVFGAVSDHQDFQAPIQPAARRPVRMTPISPQRLVVEAAVLLEPTDKVPPIVANPLEQRLGRLPGIEEDVLRATAQPITGIAEQLKGECILRRTALVPEA
jgi:hypothetical protein